MTGERYGEHVRPWPDYGYFSDYRDLFDGFAQTVTVRDHRHHVFIRERIETLGAWQWKVGYFSWTPYGDLFESRVVGLAPNWSRAWDQANEAARSI